MSNYARMLVFSYSVLSGVIVGFTFGLTGVGSVFAVPLIVYLIGLRPHQAVCVSMVGISAISLVSTFIQVRAKQIDYRSGLILAVTGISGAPLGAWLGRGLSGSNLLTIFALFVMVVGARMLVKNPPRQGAVDGAKLSSIRKPHFLAMIGLFIGVLAGFLGIGGGFLLVPALVFIKRTAIHRAIATSLPVIFLVGLAAVLSHFLARQWVPLDLTGLFSAGGVFGALVGLEVAKHIPGARLQRIFGGLLIVMSVLLLILELRRR